MDIRELRYMVTLADARTLSRAAERLHVSRQAVAKTLRQVEKQAPARLFQRDADGITPTEQGAAFVRDAREVLGAFDELCAQHLGILSNENSSTCGCVPHEALAVALVSGGSVGLPRGLFERFVTSHPAIDLSVEEMSSDDVLEAVARDNVDVGILGTHPSLVGQFDVALIQSMGIWLLAPQGHPLAGRQRIGLQDLDGQAMVTAGSHNHLHRFVMERCVRAGVHPSIRANATEGQLIRKLALELGALFFVFPPGLRRDDNPAGTEGKKGAAAEKARGAEGSGGSYLKLDIEGGDEFGTYAIRRPDARHSHAARLFWDEAKAHVPGHGDK